LAIVTAGFAVAAHSLWIALLMLAIFLAVYLPLIGFEENFLREQFADYEQYARRVPRLFPRLRPPPAGVPGEPTRVRFSLDLYLKHREYNAVLGAAVMMAALIFKLIWFSR